jgi:hypothetical protein
MAETSFDPTTNVDWTLVCAAKWNNAEAVSVALSAGATSHLQAAQVALNGGHDQVANSIMEAYTASVHEDAQEE